MRLSTDRILTTHVGSLPRPRQLLDLLFTFAGFGRVDHDICYAKLATIAEGAALASKRLW